MLDRWSETSSRTATARRATISQTNGRFSPGCGRRSASSVSAFYSNGLGAGGEGIAVAAGVGFISFGGLCLIYAVSRYLWVAKNLEKGMFPVAIRGPIVIAFGALLVAAGAMLYVLLLH